MKFEILTGDLSNPLVALNKDMLLTEVTLCLCYRLTLAAGWELEFHLQFPVAPHDLAIRFPPISAKQKQTQM